MAKSPLARANKKLLKVTNPTANVTPISLMIPYKDPQDKKVRDFDISHLAHFRCDKDNEQIRSRLRYLRSLSKNAYNRFDNGNLSPTSMAAYYVVLTNYISFCDYKGVEPFSKEGYLAFVGNDGELRHQIKQYNPSKRLFEYADGDDIGITEYSASVKKTCLHCALNLCGIDFQSWSHLCKPFYQEKTPFKAYSRRDEQMIVSRLSELFFGLSSQLIVIKKEFQDSSFQYLDVPITINGKVETLSFSTSLNSKNKNGKGKTRTDSAFNLAMGAAYHLFCYFTSLNDSVIREVCHPLQVNISNRDKNLKTIKISGFKRRANKDVSSIVSNEMDDLEFDVEKRDGVAFIEALSELSKAYGNTDEILYMLDCNGKPNNRFDLAVLNRALTSTLNLVTSDRASNIEWFSEQFYSLWLNNESIELGTYINNFGRKVVKKTKKPISNSWKSAKLLKISYLIFSCFSDASLKGIVLPLSFSETKSDGNITVSFSRYDNDEKGSFTIPANYLKLVQDIEKWGESREYRSTQARYLLRTGTGSKPTQWEGLNPIGPTFLPSIGIFANEYFVNLSSSRFRKTTSHQEYRDGYLSHVKNILHSTLATLERHYTNGHPELNELILSQAIQVLERISKGDSLNDAKTHVREQHKIAMLAHDEWLQQKTKTNPNGISCNGQQDLISGKKTQRQTNKSMEMELPCSEFDMCYKCKSAKAVDESNSIYKLISYIDVLKEALDRYPNAKDEVQEKIAAFEYTLEGASSDVLEKAFKCFIRDGRHPRISMNHAVISINDGVI
ncbi:hypothetical protein C942_02677 [Photobacterium marinum]|uniref:Uncharacterized protein n=1 Tax=Photobacterium marinum TaxID=1056511 RepID=L8JI52_9GAMM|nr:hypothetical protein [Photobacterium marinum]ELR67169.1 hypothetical protein C942_02677 [Photobacterium marinum]